MSKEAVLTEYSLSFPKLNQPFTIAHVSDLHERRSDDILALLRQAKPDIIAVTGDTFESFENEQNRSRRNNRLGIVHRAFLTAAFKFNWFFIHVLGRKNLPDPQNAFSFLSRAAAVAPVYLSLGNHEEVLGEDVLEFFRRHEITLLDNADCTAGVRGNLLHIGGLSTEADEDWLRRFSRQSGFKLLLSHHPEYYDEMIAPLDIDLTLSGHNHGGQIKLFGKGVLSSRSGLFPKYDSGVFGNRFVVSAGCSNTAALPRWGNPRELVVIHLSK